MQVCALTVPKYSVFRNGTDKVAYLLAAGYRRTDEEEGNTPVQLETSDDFVTRMQVCMPVQIAWTPFVKCR